MSETPENVPASTYSDTVIDAAQLVRITSLHRGFLYQHLYAAACLLRFKTAGMHKLLVERDEDLEAVLPGRHLYLQVKTRSRPLQWADVSGAIDSFVTVRARHAEGRRPGSPQLVIVANVPPGPQLAAKTATADWPGDVTLLTPQTAPPDAWLPPAWNDLDEAIAWCTREAEQVPFSSLAPLTLVWKLAARVVYACTGHGDQAFTAETVEALHEQFVQELQSFPALAHDYLPQADEPDLLTKDRVRLVTGFSGAGKTAWAAHGAQHCPEPLTYFDTAALTADAVAGGLARELAARHLNTESRSGLPHACGIDLLRAVHHRLDGTAVAVVLDNVHRLGAAELKQITEALPTARLVLLGQPRPDQTTLAAHLGITAESLHGWDADRVAQVFADAGAPADAATVARLITLTGGLPLYVRNAALLAQNHYAHDTARMCRALADRQHTAPTAQDLILEEIFEGLAPHAQTTASLLALAEVPLAEDELGRLARDAGLGPKDCARGLRTLASLGILQRTGDGLTTLHDATRALATDYIPHHASTQQQFDLTLSALLHDSLTSGSASPRRLARWVRLLAHTEQTDQLLPLVSHDYFFDQPFAADLKPTLQLVADDQAAQPIDRFDALNALATLALDGDDAAAHKQLTGELAALADAHHEDWGIRETVVLADHQMHQHAYDRDTKALNAIYLATRAALPKNSAARRILRYNQAKALHQAGCYAQADTIALGLVETYMAHLGLEADDIVGASAEQVAACLSGADTDLDDCKRVADCLALRARCRRDLGQPFGLAALHALKFYQLAQAWRHFVTVGQDIVDDFVELGDLYQAMKLLDDALVPAAQRQALGGLLLAVRAQRAVVLAHAGDFATARTEIDSLLNYHMPPLKAQEISNQKNLIEQLARLEQPGPR
ncbi:ATP-binding protein [Streptomyces sp. NBC_00564]|uniref:ATP-binding protein n=1 Tax=Streptomyces sp. NBC_00564 TaxID=2903663 RepID=UPI002FCDB909|nr:ATP-binding protein [Streptomyces sp. NBC_00564]